jgi:flagellar motor switch/type III secretory pathway protein FliN
VVRRSEPVVIKADGRAWAYGVITELDGALAVTITRKLAE